MVLKLIVHVFEAHSKSRTEFNWVMGRQVTLFPTKKNNRTVYDQIMLLIDHLQYNTSLSAELDRIV